jgi:tRNA-splicing ligase RtcB
MKDEKVNDKIITGKMLKERGWPEGKIIGFAKTAAQQLSGAGKAREEILDALDAVRKSPGEFSDDAIFGALAKECLRREKDAAQLLDDALPRETEAGEEIVSQLRDAPLEYSVWGAGGIDAGAIEQMQNALRLPVSVAGALMPDAHVGYGLPIGGVLATHESVIPYAVGVDIACRMRLSVYGVSPVVLGQHKNRYAEAIEKNTKFGAGKSWSGKERAEHPVLDEAAWKQTPLLRSLQAKAAEQLGTSGSGNHFVEWGAFELEEDALEIGLKAGKYLALLSHSGSRGVGFKIANEYSRLAMSLHPRLEKAARHLAWLPMEREVGQEYWHAMELAGRFASANHFVIHQRVAAALGLEEIASVENHHNFAWKEKLANGDEAIVHRKGATPAGAGVLGVIPGSMGDAGYVVAGKGVMSSLNSASHGAGRKLGRKAAISSITKKQRDDYLKARGVTLLGGGIDESPQAYKDIETVIAAQGELVKVLGKFSPKIVKMASEAGDV